MSDVLKDLLFQIRQHPGFQELLRANAPPPAARFKKGDSVEEFGARAIHTSGMRDQYDRLHSLLTGQASQETNSQQEKL